MIATLNVRGGTHNSCEDSIYWQEVDDFIYGGVFDGCSSGYKSHWASQTLAYLFAKGFQDPTTNLRASEVYNSLKMLAIMLGITEMSMLSTCILFSYNQLTKELKVRAFGDGYYYVNDIEYEIEQNNQPDYLAYVMRDDALPVFLKMYTTKTYQNVNKFQICSDGIRSIDRPQLIDSQPKCSNPLSLLLHPPTGENYLQRQWNILKRDSWTIADDLSIISYVQDSEPVQVHQEGDNMGSS
jgi:hypothetical protein